MSDYYGCESLGFYFAKLGDVLLVWTQSISSVLLLARVSRWKTAESWPEPTFVRASRSFSDFRIFTGALFKDILALPLHSHV